MQNTILIGTTLGGADITQWQETQNSFLEFELPLKIKSIKYLIGYISVRGISANGMVERVNGTIKNATVKAIMYQNIDEMKQDLNKFLIFYNFNRGHNHDIA
jgi:hypothetical protein